MRMDYLRGVASSLHSDREGVLLSWLSHPDPSPLPSHWPRMSPLCVQLNTSHLSGDVCAGHHPSPSYHSLFFSSNALLPEIVS